MLTEIQKQIVSDNHNLIYWYAHLSRLDLEEWYDLLAIELCHSVQRHDELRGTLSTYYKTRCDWLVLNEFRKHNRKKRFHINVEYIPEIHSSTTGIQDDEIHVTDILNDPEYGKIIRLKFDGYTQQEIAEQLGVSQSYISNTLKKIRRKYYANY